ncbi:response regulator transcription factor [Alteromonas sp. a30]|uniref:response regulator transcription factor n=1 Tax=Alteromonas sp. a30 TaxID=2730917 RepID=UPI002282D7F8|nr:response regulator transcription factor [Alteromonas sp. a30]MCY7295694.1 response regulator transcription factor [Alteromonas sp. a30]
MTTLLLVEDDEQLLSVIAAYLELNDFKVLQCEDAAGCLMTIEHHHIDLIVLDLTLPDEDGLVLLRRLRASNSIPIIVVSGRTSGNDRVAGLEFGADDYLCKPFLPKELLYRVNNILSRSGVVDKALDNQVHFHGWRLDMSDKALFDDRGFEVQLTRHEFQLLTALARHPGRTYSREELIDMFNDLEGPESTRAIDITISRLRKKIEMNVKKPEKIITVKGLGYKLSRG